MMTWVHGLAFALVPLGIMADYELGRFTQCRKAVFEMFAPRGFIKLDDGGHVQRLS